MEISELPAIKILQGPTPEQTKRGDDFLGPMSNRASSWSEAAEASPFDSQQAYVFLFTRHDSAKKATLRQRYMFGRLYNGLTGEVPYYARLPGTILRDFFGLSGQPTPEWVIAGGDYLLRIDYSERFLALMKHKLDTPDAPSLKPEGAHD